MYHNIARKIKDLAELFTGFGIALSVLTGLIVIGSGDLVGLGILIILLGSLLSWVSSMCLYGFGQLIEHTANIDRKLSNPLRQENDADDDFEDDDED